MNLMFQALWYFFLDGNVLHFIIWILNPYTHTHIYRNLYSAKLSNSKDDTLLEYSKVLSTKQYQSAKELALNIWIILWPCIISNLSKYKLTYSRYSKQDSFIPSRFINCSTSGDSDQIWWVAEIIKSCSNVSMFAPHEIISCIMPLGPVLSERILSDISLWCSL